ncbi:MAG: response regulator transcription factor [Actinomycetota bacterium]|nr:response regulator transcription factor [Actinomycetota bacterium]
MRLAIVADHRLTAEAIRRALRHAPACQIIGYVDARRSCALPVANGCVDVVLLDDLGTPDITLGRIRELRVAAPQAKLVLLTPIMEPDWLAAAATAGIDAAIGRTEDLERVGMLVREVVMDNMFHAFRPAPAAVQRSHAGAEILTPRELEVLRLVANGASNGRVAAELRVTEQTVKFHLSNVYLKLGVANRTEASHYAHLIGLLDTWTTAPRNVEAA